MDDKVKQKFVVLNGVDLLIHKTYVYKTSLNNHNVPRWLKLPFTFYKTNSIAVTKAHKGLNTSVYAVLWLKTKFDVNKFGFAPFPVLYNIKCPGRGDAIWTTGKLIEVWPKIGQKRFFNVCSDNECTHNQSNYNNKLFCYFIKIFWRFPRLMQYDKMFIDSLLSWS